MNGDSCLNLAGALFWLESIGSMPSLLQIENLVSKETFALVSFEIGHNLQPRNSNMIHCVMPLEYKLCLSHSKLETPLKCSIEQKSSGGLESNRARR